MHMTSTTENISLNQKQNFRISKSMYEALQKTQYEVFLPTYNVLNGRERQKNRRTFRSFRRNSDKEKNAHQQSKQKPDNSHCNTKQLFQKIQQATLEKYSLGNIQSQKELVQKRKVDRSLNKINIRACLKKAEKQKYRFEHFLTEELHGQHILTQIIAQKKAFVHKNDLLSPNTSFFLQTKEKHKKAIFRSQIYKKKPIVTYHTIDRSDLENKNSQAPEPWRSQDQDQFLLPRDKFFEGC